jgi:hypothetical protein
MGDRSVCYEGRTHLSQRTGYASGPSQAPRRRPFRKTRPPDLFPSFPSNNLEKLPSPQLITFLRVHDHPVHITPVSQHPRRRTAYVAASACATPRVHRHSSVLSTQQFTTTRVISENPDIVGTARGVGLRTRAPLSSQSGSRTID